jgi:hypothetical protein
VVRNIFRSATNRKRSEIPISAHKYLIKYLATEIPRWSLVTLLRAWENGKENFHSMRRKQNIDNK